MFYLIGLAGVNGVGKSTTAKELKGFEDIIGHKVILESFAQPIREVAQKLGFSVEYGKKDKEKLSIPIEKLNGTLMEYMKTVCNTDEAREVVLGALGYMQHFITAGHYNMTCRDFMICLGTAGRDLASDFWMCRMIERVMLVEGYRNSLVILDDVRFENEAELCDKVFFLTDPDKDGYSEVEGSPYIDYYFNVKDPKYYETMFTILEYKLT